MKKTFIIAEAGANHNRDWDMACQLIREASDSGADAVKFQTYSSETLYSRYTPDFAGYKDITKLIKDIELPRSWQKDLKLYCDDLGIEFMSTPFDERAVDELYDLGVKRLKIAGFEATDPRWVKYVASTGLPLIISLGTGATHNTMTEVQQWILGPEVMGDPKIHLGTYDFSNNPDVTYLHCNSAYPTPLDDINLGSIKIFKNLSKNHKWLKNTKVGLSDHTTGILIPPLAVAMGASVIEKHYTLSRSLDGPDHTFAIEPNELRQMVSNIRDTERCLGVKNQVYTESEKEFSKGRRSVVASQKIKKGDVLTENNITTKRPLLEDSIPALNYYEVLGMIAKKDLQEDEILKSGYILSSRN
jgi:N,N'-diacetyllegionaminate synthase